MSYNWTLLGSPNGNTTGFVGNVAGPTSLDAVATWNDPGTGQVEAAYSTDGGATWHAATVPADTADAIIDVGALGLFAIIGTQGSNDDIFRSTDGGHTYAIIAPNPTSTWASYLAGSAAVGIVGNSAGLWVLFNFAGPDTSTSANNGATWTQHAGVGIHNGWNNSQALWDGTNFVHIAYDNSGNTYVGHSTTGAAWTFTAATALALGQVVYNGTEYAASTGSTGIVISATIAGLATAALIDLSAQGITAGTQVVWDSTASVWVVMDSVGNVATSPDGITWTAGGTVYPGSVPTIVSGGLGTIGFDAGDGNAYSGVFAATPVTTASATPGVPIDPRGMRDVVEWADFITLPLNQLGVSPRRLNDPKNWKNWAYNLVQSSQLAGYQPPDPRGFGDDEWEEWAFRFNQTVPY